MNSPKLPTQSRIIQLVLILGLIAFILYIYGFVDIPELIVTFSTIKPEFYFAAFAAYIFYTFFSALVWHRLLNNLAVPITRRKAFVFTWVGLFFDATVPQLGWSAEVSKTYMLTKDSKVDTSKVTASVVGQKLFTNTITVVAMTLGLGLVLLNYTIDPLTTILIVLVLALSILTLGVIYWVSIKQSATKTLLNFAVKTVQTFRKTWNPEGFKLKAEALLGGFHISFKQLKAKPKALVEPAVYSIIGFIFEVSVVFLCFIALGYNVPVDKVLIVFTLTGTLQTVGVVIGVPDIVMTISFSALGIPEEISAAVTILTRVVNLWFRLAVSYVALQWAGLKIIRQNRTI
jgi:uncharacterized protein (TIRG00374 family)